MSLTNVTKIPLRQHAALMRRLSKQDLPAALERGLSNYGFKFLRRLVLERLTKSGVQPPGGGLAVRSGELRRSFMWGATSPTRELVEQRGVSGVLAQNSLRLRIFSDSRYAAIHELGGVILPKRSRYLTIPLAAARTGAGVSRGSARMFQDTFVARSKAGNLIIFQKRGNSILPLFVLKERVQIPARLGLRKLAKDMAPERASTMKKALIRAWETAEASEPGA